MAVTSWTTGVSAIDLADHSARHEDGGADEISIEGLAGAPAVIDNTISYKGVVVIHEGNLVTL